MLAVAPCGSFEKNCWGWEGVSIFRSVCADRPQENDWMTGVWMTCVLVADVSEATWCWAGCGPGWSNAWWCVFCRRGCQMSLMCNPLFCGTVWNCVVGSRWLLKLVRYASVEWMWWGCCLPSWSCVVVVRVSRWLICPRPLVVGRLCVP